MTVYVLDTGMDTAHPEFEGRAQAAFNAVDRTTGDCDGHGTVVAGIAASRLHGVAPQAQVRSVKVLDCNGVGRLSSLLAGIDWVTRNAQRPAVAVMSWSFGRSDALAAAVRTLVDSGVFVAASAGNTGADDCAALPRSVPGVTVVAELDPRRQAGPDVEHRQLRGRLRPRGVDHVDDGEGRDRVVVGHVDGRPARRGGRRALQADVRRRPERGRRAAGSSSTPRRGSSPAAASGGTPNRLLYAGDL